VIKTKEMGRLAIRVEGTLWCAYWALPNTMDGALFLGSIRLAFVDNVKRKEAFIDLMRDAVGEMLKAQGMIPESWDRRKAPEHERGGNA
jgi:hypothetical protein